MLQEKEKDTIRKKKKKEKRKENQNGVIKLARKVKNGIIIASKMKKMNTMMEIADT